MRNSSVFDNSVIEEMANLYSAEINSKSSEDIMLEDLAIQAERNGELVDEAWWDRAKMRLQQGKGKVQGAYQQAKGAVQNAAGNVVNKVGNVAAKGVQAVGGTIDPSQNRIVNKGQQLQQQGQQNIQQGQQRGQQELVKAATNISVQRTQALLTDIQNDLAQVGINATIPQAEIKRIQTVILNAIQRAM